MVLAFSLQCAFKHTIMNAYSLLGFNELNIISNVSLHEHCKIDRFTCRSMYYSHKTNSVGNVYQEFIIPKWNTISTPEI